MAGEILYRKIFDDLLNGIRSGVYPSGTRLPSEIELAEKYGVSRITSKKALEMLADRDMVLRRPGKGTFVTWQGTSNPAVEESDFPEDSAPATGEKATPDVIGVIFDSIDVSFGYEVLQGITYESTRRGLLMFWRMTYGSDEAEKRAIEDMLAAGAKGIILMCTQNKSYNPTLLKLYLNGFPMVLVDRELKGIPVPVVATDNFRAGYDLTTRLIESGHRKIGFISHSHVETSTVAARFEGYCEALRDHGIMADASNMLRNMDAYMPVEDDGNSSFAMYRNELSEFVDNHPDLTAFYTVEFSIARLLYEILQEKGLQDKKALVYFDGFMGRTTPLSRNCLHIIQGQYEMGVKAVRHLAHRMRGEQVPERDYIPYTFVEPEA
ncbi:MAG: GntR family transcriptional regulator [Clostridia bacterium]|nr:GntR family transcriptional regulator [Clostridia bacterium]